MSQANVTTALDRLRHSERILGALLDLLVMADVLPPGDRHAVLAEVLSVSARSLNPTLIPQELQVRLAEMASDFATVQLVDITRGMDREIRAAGSEPDAVLLDVARKSRQRLMTMLAPEDR